MRIPSELIPYCPHCGSHMTVNLRSDDNFVEDRGWHEAAERYQKFVDNHRNGKVLYLELGVGSNTPDNQISFLEDDILQSRCGIRLHKL